MWKKQIRAERAAEKASEMVARARALSEAASIQTPGTHSGKANGGNAEVSEYDGDNHSRSLISSSLATRALTRITDSRINDDSSSSKSSSSSDSDDHKLDEDRRTENKKSDDRKGSDKSNKSNSR